MGTGQKQHLQIGHPVIQVALRILLFGAGQYRLSLAEFLADIKGEGRVDPAGYGIVQGQLVLPVQRVGNQPGINRLRKLALQGCRVLRRFGRVRLILVIQVQQVIGIGCVLAALVAAHLLLVGFEALFALAQLFLINAAQLIERRFHLPVRSRQLAGVGGNGRPIPGHELVARCRGAGRHRRAGRVRRGAVHDSGRAAGHAQRRAAPSHSIRRANGLPVGAPVVL